MIKRAFVNIFFCAGLLVNSIFPFETDQYNLPPKPLADIGAEFSEYVRENLQIAADELNAKISVSLKCLEKSAENCRNAEKERGKIADWQSEDALAKEVYNRLGAGTIPFTKSQNWIDSHKFKAQPARYKTDFEDSIYKIIPTNFLTISATVNLYGAEFGTDKIAHIFQQGYTYYTKYGRGVREKLSEKQAARKAVRWGILSEKTYYGTLVSGVYSNADLAANFAGMKFYLNLTQKIKIGNTEKTPIFTLENGLWKFSDDTDFFKPFISEHLNEALNPSKYTAVLRSFVRRVVREKSCPQWQKKFPERTRKDFENLTENLKFWHGEDYGFSASKKFVTVADTCFAE